MACLFCKIAAKEIPAKMIYDETSILAFEDIAPQAPHHILIIPRKHITTINELQLEDNVLIGNMMLIAKKLAHDFNLAEEGYRVVMNCNRFGGQAVDHIHFHLLGGRQMSWPPG